MTQKLRYVLIFMASLFLSQSAWSEPQKKVTPEKKVVQKKAITQNSGVPQKKGVTPKNSTSQKKIVVQKIYKPTVAARKPQSRNLASVKNRKTTSVIKPSQIKKRPVRAMTAAEKKKVKKIINDIVVEFQKTKTVRDWINNSPKSVKLYRRQFFSKHMNETLPKVVGSSTGLLIFTTGKKRQADVISYVATPSGLKTYYNNLDITVRKGEAVEKWQRRVFSNNRVAQFSFFFNPLYAQPPENFWANMIGSMSEDAWRNSHLENSDGAALLRQAEDLMQNNDLQCAGGDATFRNSLGNTTQMIAARRSYTNPDYLDLQFGSTENRNQPLFNIEYQPDNSMFFLRSRALPNAEGEVYGTDFLPNLAGLINTDRARTFGSQPQMDTTTMLNNSMAFNVCNTLAQNGMDECIDTTEPQEYLQCVNNRVLSESLPGTVSFNNALSRLSRDAGLALKSDLARLMAPGSINIPQANVYPSLDPTLHNNLTVNIPFNMSAPGVSRERLIESLTSGLRVGGGLLGRESTTEVLFNNCLQSLQEQPIMTRACEAYHKSFTDPSESSQALNTVWNLIEAIQNTSANPAPRSISGLQADRASAQVQDPRCATQFSNPEQESAMQYYSDLEQVGGLSSIPSHLNSIVHAADAARACCTNRTCEAFVRGQLSEENIQRVRSSQ